MPATVVHALAVRPGGPDVVQVRATVREGALAPGDVVWFTSRAAERRTVRVRAVIPGRRHLLVELEGPHVAELHGGGYLYRD